uniref:Alpha-galactosidase n=1 Tax=Ditylenchus dipsaci TaxID=166011 RepID=A0A915DB83_9BILA
MKKGYPEMQGYLNQTNRPIVYSLQLACLFDSESRKSGLCNKLSKAQGPGKWNDPDMIIVGNTELTVDQSKAQMTIWCIWSAP